MSPRERGRLARIHRTDTVSPSPCRGCPAYRGPLRIAAGLTVISFSVKELVARICAVLKRTAPVGDDHPIEIDGLRLDSVSHRVTGHGETIHAGPTEFCMLHFFMSHPERGFTRGQLLDRVWGRNVYIEERTVDVHIRRLRKALAGHGFDKLVQTVHGTGYRFSRNPQ